MALARTPAGLADQLRAEDTPISPHVVDPAEPPALGALAAAGPRAAAAPGEYALVVEAVREGYLLHYGEPRLLAGHDPDLALLAGDYLYALGLERLAALGDLDAVARARRPDQPLRAAARASGDGDRLAPARCGWRRSSRWAGPASTSGEGALRAAIRDAALLSRGRSPSRADGGHGRRLARPPRQ